MKMKFAGLAAAMAVGGCVAAADVKPIFVPLSTYQALSCADLSAEENRILTYMPEAEKQHTIAQNQRGNAAAMGVLAGPLAMQAGLSAVDKEKEMQLPRLKGELDAVRAVQTSKSCKRTGGAAV